MLKLNEIYVPRLAKTNDVKQVLARHNAVEALMTRGFVEIPIDAKFLVEHVPRIKAGLRRITAEDNPDRARFEHDDVIFYDEAGWSHNSGLYRRKDDENKWFFHLYRDTYLRMLERGVPVAAYDEFFNAMADVNTHAHIISRAVAELFDERGLTRTPIGPKFEAGQTVTRGLRYLKRTEGQIADAKTHLDRNGVTVHWWSSAEGLVVFDRGNKPHRVAEKSHDSICIFFGKKWAGVTRGHYGLGSPHGVSVSRGDSDEDRFALVSFTHCTLDPEDVAYLKEHKGDFDALEAECVL